MNPIKLSPIQASLLTIPIVFIFTSILLAIFKPHCILAKGTSIRLSILFMYAFTISLASSIVTLLMWR